jgi:hypothetical protein
MYMYEYLYLYYVSKNRRGTCTEHSTCHWQVYACNELVMGLMMGSQASRGSASRFTRTCISINLYKHTYTHHTSTSPSKRLSQLDLEIYKVDHQKRLAVDENIVFH